MEYLRYSDNFWLRAYKVSGIIPDLFQGSVLYLGMGTSLFPRMQSNKVTKTTIVEINQEVVDFNYKSNHIHEDWNIIIDDAFTFETEEFFDTIFIDIFYEAIDKDVMYGLVDKYTKNLNEGGKIIYVRSIVERYGC